MFDTARHYWRKLRALDAEWHKANADLDQSSALLPPSIEIAIAVLGIGAAVCFIGGIAAGWWL
jgi:hypothetical protein